MSEFHQAMREGCTTGPGRQHTNPVRAQRRRAIRNWGGIRQFKRAQAYAERLRRLEKVYAA